jgi:hypothetical protein
MGPHQTVTGFLIAGMTGNNHIPPVYPYTHIPSRYEKRITVMAVLPTELPINSNPLAHRNFSRDIDIAIAPFRV